MCPGAVASDRLFMTPQLNKIADVAGLDAALTLGREKASRRIYIPAVVSAKHWLAQLVGLEAARAIAAEFGSQEIIVPAAIAGQRRRRREAVLHLTALGWSADDIASTLGIHRATVFNIRRSAPKASSDQGDLFERED